MSQCMRSMQFLFSAHGAAGSPAKLDFSSVALDFASIDWPGILRQ